MLNQRLYSQATDCLKLQTSLNLKTNQPLFYQPFLSSHYPQQSPMNYPFDAHNSSSQNSKNEFMLSQSSMLSSAFTSNPNPTNNNNQVQKIFHYMKNVMSNPLLMDQMEKFLASKQSQKNTSFVNQHNQSLSVSRMENQLRHPPISYANESSYQPRPQPLRANPHANVKKVKVTEPSTHVANRKKSDDGLMAYISTGPVQQSQVVEKPRTFEPKANSDDRPIKPMAVQPTYTKPQQKPLPQAKPPVSFEDIPIKSNYIANGQFSNFNSQSAYPQNQSINFDSKPVKKPVKTSASTKNNSNANLEKAIQLQERPITGTKKDFKELLKDKFGETPFDEKPIPALANDSQNTWADHYQQNEFNQDDENHEQHKPKRQFLKRGTRQYLSSAKDKKFVKKKPNPDAKQKDSQENLNSSRLGPTTNSQRDKTPTKRDLSQNRVLSKRNTVNDKSVSKLKTHNNLNNSYNERQEDEPQRTITPKNQRPGLKSKSPALPPKNTKPAQMSKTTIPNGLNAGSGKKKNVFDDSSSSEGQAEYQSEQRAKDEDHFSKRQHNGQKQKKYSSYQPENEFNMFSREKKEQVIEGVYLTRTQLNTIFEKYGQAKTQPSKNTNNSQQKFNQLRKKYTDLCNLLEKQKLEHEQQMEKEKQQFENLKQQELQKIKNQRRVMERQLKSSMPSQSQNLQKDKEEIENLKKQLEKEKEQHKKKQKNHKILIEKYKKENEDLKLRLEHLEDQLDKHSQTSTQNNFSTHSDKPSAQSNPRPSTSTHDKSKSKPTTKDLSPAKPKMNKSSKTYEQNEEDNDQDKNYKKTVPLYKQGQDKKTASTSLNENSKKGSEKGTKFTNDDQISDDDNLPTFKVDNKKPEETKGVKAQKKYQYIENQVEQGQSKKEMPSKNSSNHRKTGSKNVFVDESDDDQNENRSENEHSGEEEQTGGFFKPASRYEKLSDLMSTNFSIKEVSEQMIQTLFRYQSNAQYRRYLQRTNNPKRMIVNSSKNGVDKKITNIYNDKSKEILFENGVKKEIFEDGYTIIYFKNGDIKQKLEDGTTLYYFSDKKVDQITLVNGLNIYRFDNNQVEIHYDGNKYIEIRNPDGTIKMLGSPVH